MAIGSDEYPMYYEFPGRGKETKKMEARLCDVAQTRAAVIVNSIGSDALFRGSIAQSVLAATGPEIGELVQRHTPIEPGGVVITNAGQLATARYVFHAVVTRAEDSDRTDPDLIIPVTERCVQLAELLGLRTIAIPPFGTGMGRGKPAQVVKDMLNAILDRLPKCDALERIIFATTSVESFALFGNLALVDVALARREQELKGALLSLSPSLYGEIGKLLLRMEAAREAGENAEALQEQAEGFVEVARGLGEVLPPDSGFYGTIQLIIATGGSIIRNVAQQVGV